MATKTKTVMKSDKNTTFASGSDITAAEHRAFLEDLIDSYEDFIGSYTTANIALIASPTLRQIVYDITLNDYFYYNGTAWVQFGSKWKAGAGSGSLMDKRSTSAAGIQSTVIGTLAECDGAFSNAVGHSAINRLTGTTVISGVQMIRKDNGESSAPAFIFTAGEVIIVSYEINLKATATVAITLPANLKFFVNEVGIICTQYSSVNTQPTVSYGKAASNAYLKAAAITTDLTAAGSRERETTLLTAEGLTSLTAEITIAATGTTLQGRFYFKGFVVEDE